MSASSYCVVTGRALCDRPTRQPTTYWKPIAHAADPASAESQLSAIEV
ncbi:MULTISPECIES: hypothetical protein [unclassified Microcoleus]|nr:MULTISPECIES: hypothetical protein [unclassified Microcoleus]MCC3420057.1 hypothetical protein [Microcoleus sp. PH2017_07_MST_O_A]MCC3430412.1 hypothetical protein [Microcoleus sp. PH2017_04_SCI_O_A]MCC3441864.1 hypothetical protein [Microcoleus sp. PH2017_03_ELD_O_A]MCC3466210.1 hypothetical protein [Microcoleus sp. PH2017_06_SFM_O_A]MCC3504186.1 hypothetical protein [Microcoleus sp. PH2017_19_SFW_U_A]MCC3510783.1 hypothetical protein [Microcoleus sp. PH2017_17_BER_D_A]